MCLRCACSVQSATPRLPSRSAPRIASADDGWLTSDLLKACAAWAPLCAWALALAAGPRAPRVDAPAATPRPTPTPAAPATPHASLRHGACTQCFHEDGGPSVRRLLLLLRGGGWASAAEAPCPAMHAASTDPFLTPHANPVHL